MPSIVITDFSLDLTIESSCAFPSPEDPKETFVPASALLLVVASLKLSLSTLIA